MGATLVIPGNRSEAEEDPGPIGPIVVERGPPLMSARRSNVVPTRNPAVLINGSRVSLRSPGMTVASLMPESDWRSP